MTFNDIHAQSAAAASRAITPMAFVRAMANGCHRLGYSPIESLVATQIEPARLSIPLDKITATQMERLSDRLMRMLDDEALGWFRRRLPWGSYGMLARASISAPTLAIAMKRWCRHHALLTDDVRLHLTVSDNGIATISLTEVQPGNWLIGEMQEFCHVSLLRNLMGLASWLADTRLPLTGAEFAYAAPPHATAYEVLFPTQCLFSRSQTQIHFDSGYLNLPVRRDEAALHQMLKHALPLTVHAYRRDRLLVARVRDILRSDPSTMHNAEILAERLHLSVRTLHRQLKQDGSSLQQLKNTVRFDLATELLLRTQRPIKQIALAVGFDNDKGFIRAFKQWSGMTPSSLRERDQKH